MSHSIQIDAEFLEDPELNAAASSNQVAGLQASHLLNLQCTELLQACLLSTESSSSWFPAATEYTRVLADLLHAMPPLARGMIESSDVNATTKTIQGQNPFLPPLRVLMPSQYSSGQSVLLTTAANAHVLPTQALTVLLPTAFFSKNDYRKGRYFEKRNVVVEKVANYLAQQSPSLVGTVHYRYWKADPRKLCLVLVPPVCGDATKTKKKKAKEVVSFKKSKRNRFIVELHFQMESIDWIPPLRLVPNRCNITVNSNDAESTGDANTSGSVHYNFCLTEDCRHALSVNHLDDTPTTTTTEAAAESFKAACALIQIWCLQRGLWRGHDTLDGEMVQMLILYLYRTKQVNLRMSPLQVVTALFKLLAETAWLMDGNFKSQKRTVLVLPAFTGQTLNQTVIASELAQMYAIATRESPVSEDDPPTLLELHQHGGMDGLFSPPVLLDSTLRHNYLGRLAPASMRFLQRQAAASLQCLTSAAAVAAERPRSLPFQHLFLTPVRFWTRHDAYLRIPLTDIQWPNQSTGVTTKSRAVWGCDRADLGNDYESIARGVVDTLRRALGDRILDLTLLTTGNGDASKKSLTVFDDSDEIPTFAIMDSQKFSKKKLQSPIGSNYVVLGLSVNPDTCFRVVDRGPPNEHVIALQKFLQLWGPKAELRRFQDGAIVHAVVWDYDDSTDDSYTTYQNDNAWQGGIVERIIRHILKLHFLKSGATIPQFSLRDILSTVDGVAACKNTAAAASPNNKLFTNPLAAHRTVMKAFEALADFFRKKSTLNIPISGSATDMKSALGLPLAIDAVEPLSPALRYAALYPPLPHPLLGTLLLSGQTKTASGAVQSDPIAIQIRFGASSKWPTDLKAIGAAKSAMLIALVNGIESLKKKNGADEGCQHWEGPMIVTPSYADISFMGYVFRVFVRADPELKLLRGLQQPSPEAARWLQTLTKTTIVAATHHSLLHAVYTRHPSSSTTVRMAKRWLDTHLLSDQIPFEALELLVAHVFTSGIGPIEAPGTVTTGFLRFLHLLATHDWLKQPLIVDPQRHMTADDYSVIQFQFEKARGDSYLHGPALYVVSPFLHSHQEDDAPPTDRVLYKGERVKSWFPTFTASLPERVALSRSVALAERTHAYLRKLLTGFDQNHAWPGAFKESTESFRSYSVLLRVDPAFVVNTEASSSSAPQQPSKSLLVGKNKLSNELDSTYTRSMRNLAQGPVALRKKLYRNLMVEENESDVLLEWRPIQAMVQTLRARLGGLALFFYNELCPEVIAVVWRPSIFQPRCFSAVTSEYARPILSDDHWQADTMFTLNVGDILRELRCQTIDIVIDTKVFDKGPTIPEPSDTRISKRKLADVVNREESEADSSKSE